MKKNLFLFSLISFCIFIGCNKDNNENDSNPERFVTGFSGNYMDGFFNPDSMYISYNDFHKSIFITFVYENKCKYTSQGEALKKYNMYAKYYGDTTYTYHHNITPIENGCVAPLNSISIVADRDFDNEHPAGTSLNDICTMTYLPFHSFLKNGYVGCDDFAKNYPGDSIVGLNGVKDISLISCQNTTISFVKKPEPGKYTFTVTLDFGNDPLTGEKVTVQPANVEIEF